MIRCIAIDDEPLALLQIAAYISQTGNLSCHFSVYVLSKNNFLMINS